MKNINKLNCRQVMYYLNIIAEKEQEHARELAEKDKIIQYYAKHDALATERKKRAIINSERNAKLNFSYALLLFSGMMIPWIFWLIDFAAKNFWLWANGR